MAKIIPGIQLQVAIFLFGTLEKCILQVLLQFSWSLVTRQWIAINPRPRTSIPGLVALLSPLSKKTHQRMEGAQIPE